MLYKTKGIVLHKIKYGDSSIIAHIYTREFGRQSYLVNGVRKKNSKFHFNNFQPLTILNLQVDHKPTRELQRLRELNISHPFHHVHTDITKNTIALFIGEVLYRTLNEVEQNYALFDYLEGAIQFLDFCEAGCNNFHLIFLIQFTRFLGIFPVNNTELSRFQPEDADIEMKDLLNYSLKEIDKLNISKHLRNSYVNSIIEYYHYHLESMGKINSLSVLQDVFS